MGAISMDPTMLGEGDVLLSDVPVISTPAPGKRKPGRPRKVQVKEEPATPQAQKPKPVEPGNLPILTLIIITELN